MYAPNGDRSEPASVYILDIDGTLLRTHEIDNACYWDAVEQVFGYHDQSGALENYQHVSDSGILEQWCRQSLGRAPRIDETEALRSLFLDLVKTQAQLQPELFRPRAGLLEWLEQKHQQPDTHLAIATGSWGNTAEFKLQTSGLARYRMTMATGDDAIVRTDIMTTALERLGLPASPAPGRITYIGDGAWDFHASQALGWSFIGIADGARATNLRDLGASRVHADFRPLFNGLEP